MLFLLAVTPEQRPNKFKFVEHFNARAPHQRSNLVLLTFSSIRFKQQTSKPAQALIIVSDGNYPSLTTLSLTRLEQQPKPPRSKMCKYILLHHGKCGCSSWVIDPDAFTCMTAKRNCYPCLFDTRRLEHDGYAHANGRCGFCQDEYDEKNFAKKAKKPAAAEEYVRRGGALGNCLNQ